jgi:hypothetical protein
MIRHIADLPRTNVVGFVASAIGRRLDISKPNPARRKVVEHAKEEALRGPAHFALFRVTADKEVWLDGVILPDGEFEDLAGPAFRDVLNVSAHYPRRD